MKKLFFYNKEKLVYEPIKWSGYAYYIGIPVATFGLGWALSTNTYITNIIHRTDTIQNGNVGFSEDALIGLIKDCNIKYPYIVLAQAKLESSHFTSELFKKNNNMFGMKKARRRITSSQDEKGSYAYYRDWMDCIYDYAMYQSEVMCSVSNEDEYFAKLKERYAEDPQYVDKLRYIIKTEKLKNIFED